MINPEVIMQKENKPFGLWPSPISPELIGSGIRLDDVLFSPDGNYLVWLQSQNGVPSIYIQQGTEAPTQISSGFKPRGGISYGGGEIGLSESGVFFSEANGRIYSKKFKSGLPKPVTPEFGATASPTPSPDGEYLLFLHHYEGKDVLAGTKADGSTWPKILAQGADFYFQPTWHPGGKKIAWMEWDHPNMPWDGSRLILADFDSENLVLTNQRQIDGSQVIAVSQPVFSPNGRYLAWLANRTEFDEIVVMDLESGTQERLLEGQVLLPPAWVPGQHNLVWLPDSEHLAVIITKDGLQKLVEISLNGELSTLQTSAYSVLRQLSCSPSGELACIAEAPDAPPVILVGDGQSWRIAARSDAQIFSSEELAPAQAVSWKSSDGVDIHGYYYAPTNPRFCAAGAPPMLVHIHGGPTSQELPGYRLGFQFYTSRGYAVLVPNYRGSTGYGRSYRDALKGQWGYIDTLDAVEGAKAMADRGLADPDKLVIIGGSAGGYAVLNALVQYPGFFKAGICSYGVSNLFLLDMDTHKFEAHYTSSLVGSLPDAAQKYHAWSPVFNADKIRDALAVFQGADDKVVPPNQSEAIVEKLRANRVPHIYKLYQGEGHGFRKAENVSDYYRSIELFLLQHVIFAP